MDGQTELGQLVPR